MSNDDPAGGLSHGKRARGHDSRTKKSKSSKPSRAKRQAALDDEEEERLTQKLFGHTGPTNVVLGNSTRGGSGARTKSRTRKTAAAQKDKDYGAPLFSLQIDTVGDATLRDDDDNNDVVRTAPIHNDARSSHVNDETIDDEGGDDDDDDKPAWVDEDDDEIETSLVGNDTNSRLKKLRRQRDEVGALSGNELNRRLRTRFQTTTQSTARTDWADLLHDTARAKNNRHDDADNEDDETDLKSTSATLLASDSPGGMNGQSLPPNMINIKRCPDANLTDVSKATVQAVHFHPASNPDKPILLTAGFDKTLRFFSVSEEKSSKIHGIHFPKMPIYSAFFLGHTGNVVVSGRRSYFYLYDATADKVITISKIPGRAEKSWERCVASPDGRTVAFCGNDGYVILYDAVRQCAMTHFKLNGSVRAMAFTGSSGGDSDSDSTELLASGSDGDVYRFDLRSQRCLERFANQDGTITSSLAVSSRVLAVGAESGVVNLYSEHRSLRGRSSDADAAAAATTTGMHNGASTAITPLKSIMNLKTSIDMLRFNGDGQILALSSRRETSALRLLHVPTRTVFANWPTTQTPLGYVWSMDFSPSSKFIAMGNDQGKCLLYKLMHYQNATD